MASSPTLVRGSESGSAAFGDAVSHTAQVGSWMTVRLWREQGERLGMTVVGRTCTVSKIVPDSPADRAGVTEGMRIRRCNGRVVNEPDHVRAAVQAGGSEITLQVTLPGGTAPQRAGAAPPLADWSPADVSARLEEEGVGSATRSRFRQQEMSGEALLTLGREDLRQQLGLTDPSDREAAWAAVLRIRESAAPAAAESPQTAPSPAPALPLSPAADEGGAHPEGSPAAAALQLIPIYVDFHGETYCVEVSHLATVGELAAAVPGQGEMGVVICGQGEMGLDIYFGGEAVGSMTTLADAGIGPEARVEARRAPRMITPHHIIATGDNDSGQCGVPPAGGRLRHVRYVVAAGLQPPQGTEIAELCCAMHCVLLRTDQGDVLHAGSNESGVRGEQADDLPHPELHRVPLPGVAVSIAIGELHAAAVLADRSVHTWGDDSMEKVLGRDGASYVPQAVPGISDAERVSTGIRCTFVHRRGDEVSAWGANFHGELCLGRKSEVEAYPQRVAALCGVPLLHISGGYEHCIALRADGAALVWGAIHSSLADGSACWTEQRGCLPIVLQIGPQVCVSAGARHCGTVGRDGLLRAWGDLLEPQPTVAPLPGDAPAREVVCGEVSLFACAEGGEWAEWVGDPDQDQLTMVPLPGEVAGCRRVVTGCSTGFDLYLCAL